MTKPPDQLANFSKARRSLSFSRLEVLRFAAAMAIVWIHCSEYLEFFDPIRLHLIFFVDVFFAISGFILCYAYDERLDSAALIKDFYVARIARIIPLHWATLAFYATLALAAGALGASADNADRYDMRCLLPNVFLLHAWNVCDGLTFNYVSWSLSAEAAAYITFPFLVLFSARVPRLFFVFACICAAFVALLPHWESRTFDFGVLRIVPGFLSGMIVYRFRHNLPACNTIIPLCLLVLAASLPPVVCPEWVRPILGFIAVTLVISRDISKPASAGLDRLSKFGELTFSVYMLHPVVLTVLIAVFGTAFLGLQGLAHDLLVLAVPIVTIVVSYLSLRLFEGPSRRFIRQAWQQRK